MDNARAAAILALRLGRFGDPWTLDQVAAHFEISRERVRYIEAKAARELSQNEIESCFLSYPLVKMPDGRWLPDPNAGRSTG